MGAAGGFAGTPLAQGVGSEVERAHDSQAQQRRVQSQTKAADAAGIGKTDEDAQTEDRDADGRRLWERPLTPGAEDAQATQGEAESSRPVKDPSGQSGSHLDLTG
jgi:hypothetical protein